MKINQEARLQRAGRMANLARHQHGVPQRGSSSKPGPHRTENLWRDSTPSFQPLPRNKNGGWSEVPSAAWLPNRKREPIGIRPCYLDRTAGKRSRRYFSTERLDKKSRLGSVPIMGSRPNARHAALFSPIRYFFCKSSTRAETAPFASMPPRMSGPIGVFTTPRASVRTSNVSSAMVSHLAPCTSKSKVN